MKAGNPIPLPDERAQAEWRPASNGAGARRWFLFRNAEDVTERYHYGPNGKLIRYGSYASALRAADRLEIGEG
jgi:hypothetical protein